MLKKYLQPTNSIAKLPHGGNELAQAGAEEAFAEILALISASRERALQAVNFDSYLDLRGDRGVDQLKDASRGLGRPGRPGSRRARRVHRAEGA